MSVFATNADPRLNQALARSQTINIRDVNLLSNLNPKRPL